MNVMDYQVRVEPLTAADGGGYMAYVDDLPGCMSDGETPEEAIANARDAMLDWADACLSLGRAIPSPRVLAAA